jgi:predicted RNA binding protein YcfA (HicA-like mRNA interferase family)
MGKVYTFRELRKALKRYDSRFEFYQDRGKGSHRVIYHPDVQGRSAQFPLPCHSEGSDVDSNYYKGIVRRFCLPEDFFR